MISGGPGQSLLSLYLGHLFEREEYSPAEERERERGGEWEGGEWGRESGREKENRVNKSKSKNDHEWEALL